MTSAAAPAFVIAVLKLYLDLPDTPHRASSYDQAVARLLFERGVPLDVVESALLLGSLRRLRRPAGALLLSPVRSLAYYSPVIDEILQLPLPPAFHAHLRHQANEILRPVHKSAYSRDR
ncbi:MAG: hypothetical protein IANPNBLG_05030 [Bryobacteraceae bacterium]|nr:hypothetical protein [Bryobacteraceae bacterium]